MRHSAIKCHQLHRQHQILALLRHKPLFWEPSAIHHRHKASFNWPPNTTIFIRRTLRPREVSGLLLWKYSFSLKINKTFQKTFYWRRLRSGGVNWRCNTNKSTSTAQSPSTTLPLKAAYKIGKMYAQCFILY